MNIVKTLSGNVHLTDHYGTVLKVLINVNSLEAKGDNEIIIKYGFNQWTGIIVDKVEYIEIYADPAILFEGNINDLMLMLSENFFFEITGGGGGSQDLAAVLINGNSAGANDIDMNINDILNVNIIDFDTTHHVPLAGGFAWDDNFGTFAIGNKGGAVITKIGQQEFVRVVNKTVPNIDLININYQVCVVAGATGQRLSVRLAKADSDANSAGTLGIVAETIAKNQEGFLQVVGTIEGLNTSGSLQGETWADGDILYLSPTIFGGITNIKPVAPSHLVVIGYVEYAHASKGKLYVKIDNGYELNELHDVAFPTTPIDKNILSYVAANNRWENRTADQTLGFTPVPNTRTLTINGTTQDLSANRTFTIADPAGWTYIVKSANQDVTNNATPQDDPELQFSVVAGGHYMIEMDLCWSGNNATGDYQGSFNITLGAMNGYGILLGSASATPALITANNAANALLGSFNIISTNIDFLMSCKILFNFSCTQNATIKYQLRNAVASAGATSRTWKGTILKYKRID